MLRKTFVYLSICMLVVFTTIVFPGRSSLATPITMQPPVLASTETLDRVVDTAVDILVDKVAGPAKDAIDIAGAVFKSDTANPVGSQPLPGESMENFQERKSKESSSSSSSSGCKKDCL